MNFINNQIAAKPTIKNSAQVENMVTNMLWYQQLANTAINNFEWVNLPDGVLSRYIERCLFFQGACAFIYSDEMGYVALPAAPTGDLNIYYEPTKWNVIGYNFSKGYDDSNSVFIRNNLFVTPTNEFILYYARKIADLQRTIDTQVALHKLPFIIRTSDKDILSYKNIMDKKQAGELAIFVNKNVAMDDFNVMPTPTEYVIDKLEGEKKTLINECMTLLGYTNTQTEKKERLIMDEVNANNEYTENGYVGAMLEMRKEACEKINQIFGLNVDVQIKREQGKPDFMYESEEPTSTSIEMGGEDNG